ncbi:testis-specific protein TEX28 [Anolis carolinensis]|uniref:testis-specific protein TEX28 n=1 Tax=Anolis carolinensis TaxID=28377 RepID=UPI002F2B8B1D
MVDHVSKGESSQQLEDSTSQILEAQAESSRGRSGSLASTSSQSSYRSQKDALRHRILHLSELLRVERNNRDDNTSCYVELVSKADREKAPSIRQAFERINQRSSANIAHLERRLQDCCAQLKKLEQRVLTTQESSTSAASIQHQPQPHIFTSRSSFPRLPPFHLPRIRATEAAGVAEEVNLPPLSETKETCPVPEPVPKQALEDASNQRLQELKTQLVELREDNKAMEDEWHRVDEAWRADKLQIMDLLQEEKKRRYNLEVQVNDVIQINLNEITNLKHDLACTEEKMVYQSYERSRDIWEVLESYQTRLAKLEMQQLTQQQEAMELPQASVYKLYGQLMNLLLTIAAIFLVCASTISAFALPLLRTRWRAITTLLVVIIISAAWNYFPHFAPSEWKTWLSSVS